MTFPRRQLQVQGKTLYYKTLGWIFGHRPLSNRLQQHNTWV